MKSIKNGAKGPNSVKSRTSKKSNIFSKNQMSPRSSKVLDRVDEDEEFLLIDKKGNAYDLNRD